MIELPLFARFAVVLVAGAIVGGWGVWFAMRETMHRRIRAEIERDNETERRRLEQHAEQIEQIRIEALTERDRAVAVANQARDQARKRAADAEHKAADAEIRRHNAAGTAGRRLRKLNRKQCPTAEA